MNAHSPRDLAILLNENAKRVSKRLRDSFERLAPRVPMYSSRTIDEARAQIREALDRGCKRIVCGGGDGTLVHALNHIREYVNEKNARFQEFSAEVREKIEQVRWPEIGILKLGTGNGWAHEVGSRKPAATLLRLRDEVLPTTTFDLVEAEGRIFHFSGLGYDGAILNDFFWFNEKFGRGPLAAWFKSFAGYMTSMLLKTIPEQIYRGRPNVRVTAGEGEVYAVNRAQGLRRLDVRPGDVLYEGPVGVLGASTTPSYGYGLQAFPFARMKEGFFQFRVVAATVWECLRHAPTIFRGQYEAPSFIDFLAQDIRLDFDRPVPYQVGGDSQGYRQSVRYRIADVRVDVIDFRAA
jgi:diacylglycerol kinase family enzyme